MISEVMRVWTDDQGEEQRESAGTVPEWVKALATAVAENFEVKYYTQIRGRVPRLCRFVFYGLKTNSQVAAYSFKVFQ
jgi:hypothetical protein